MNIGQATTLIGASARMIRDSEQIGFVAWVGGTADGGRAFSQMLRLVRRGRDLGFTIERALILLHFWRARSDSDAGIIARRHADEVKRRITAMQETVSALEHLASMVKGKAASSADTLPRHALRFLAGELASARWRAPTVRRK